MSEATLFDQEAQGALDPKGESWIPTKEDQDALTEAIEKAEDPRRADWYYDITGAQIIHSDPQQKVAKGIATTAFGDRLLFGIGYDGIVMWLEEESTKAQLDIDSPAAEAIRKHVMDAQIERRRRQVYDPRIALSRAGGQTLEIHPAFRQRAMVERNARAKAHLGVTGSSAQTAMFSLDPAKTVCVVAREQDERVATAAEIDKECEAIRGRDPREVVAVIEGSLTFCAGYVRHLMQPDWVVVCTEPDALRQMRVRVVDDAVDVLQDALDAITPDIGTQIRLIGEDVREAIEAVATREYETTPNYDEVDPRIIEGGQIETKGEYEVVQAAPPRRQPKDAQPHVRDAKAAPTPPPQGRHAPQAVRTVSGGETDVLEDVSVSDRAGDVTEDELGAYATAAADPHATGAVSGPKGAADEGGVRRAASQQDLASEYGMGQGRMPDEEIDDGEDDAEWQRAQAAMHAALAGEDPDPTRAPSLDDDVVEVEPGQRVREVEGGVEGIVQRVSEDVAVVQFSDRPEGQLDQIPVAELEVV
jgi:hypothetical protein